VSADAVDTSEMETSKSTSKVVVIAGGGTGGHIYPGLAVAKELTARGYSVHWVGAAGGLEEKIVTHAGLPLHLIRIGKLHSSVGIVDQIKTVLGLPLAFLQALKLALQLKPQAVLGVGGFASGPFLFVSSLLNYRTVIWEPNAHAGLANRWLAKIVDECLLVFEAASRDLKGKRVHRVGLPVRDSIQPRSREAVEGRKFRVLVFGGSQGARAINRVVADWVEKTDLADGSVHLIHQTGKYDFQEISNRYEGWKAAKRKAGFADAQLNLECHEYIHDMDQRYAWADLLVCRAGASTVAEVAASGKAALFVPLPTAADNHQFKNAEVLAHANAAILVEQKDFDVATLDQTVRRLRQNLAELGELEKNVLKFSAPGAASSIASYVLGLPRSAKGNS
jgi:UDP-N-acetylglucosamine--N-acetylmuramyl-(pentapeptide) pyrophosphoryl-undecaprenol N-acetylglucosamine transferase